MLKGWHDTTTETFSTFGKISWTSSQFFSNMKSQWFWVLNQSMGVWAETYYLDFISLS